MQPFILAIDGPVASGKGTIAKKLAKKLQGIHLYTGSMYRCVALYCLEKQIDLTNEPAVVASLPNIHISFHNEEIILNNKTVTNRITESDAAAGSSVVAQYKEVRKALVLQQQHIGKDLLKKGNIVIAEGRDIGTTVFPQAQVKIFLTASVAVRAKRRLEQYHQQGLTFADALKDMEERDKRDFTRECDPLPSDPESLGYVIVDDSDLTEKQTENAILAIIQKQ